MRRDFPGSGKQSAWTLGVGESRDFFGGKSHGATSRNYSVQLVFEKRKASRKSQSEKKERKL